MNVMHIIGIDEVGRGPLAGPVTVGAILVPSNSKFQALNSKLKLKDSKKLSPKQREEWFGWAKKTQKDKRLFYATASVYPKAIDRINISRAANRAAGEVIARVIKRSGIKPRQVKVVYLDAGLRPFKKKLSTFPPRADQHLAGNFKLETIVKGDEKIPVISLASIVAKVTRDRYMRKLHNRYPQYGFDTHKGYGTKKHLAALRKRGPCPHHRLTFLKKYTIVNK